MVVMGGDWSTGQPHKRLTPARSPGPGVPLPLHGQGRRVGQQDVSVPGDEGEIVTWQLPLVASLRFAQALLNPTRMLAFLEEKVASLGTAACPPYHLALVVGGLSAEQTLKTVKYASARYYDNLPTTGSPGGRAFRDTELEAGLLALTRRLGIGAQ